MVTVVPFKGHLASKSIVQKLICPPYDVISTAEARLHAEGNPSSFLHVKRPEIDFPESQDPYATKIYQAGRKNLRQFIKKKWLEEDKVSRFYIYSQTMDGITQTGLVGGSSVLNYDQNIIKKHELTLEAKEKDRTKHVDTVGANTGLVWLTYRSEHNMSIQQKMSQICHEDEPYASVTLNQDQTTKQVLHKFWKVDARYNEWFTEAFSKVPHTYVADGHHRTAAASNVARERGVDQVQAFVGSARTSEINGNSRDFFMTILYPSDNLRIMDYNRVLKTLNDDSPSEFLTKLGSVFEISNSDTIVQTQKHTVGLYLNDGGWYKCDFKSEILEQAQKSTTPQVDTLDVQILNQKVFRDILGIENVRNDPRVDFVGGSRGVDGLLKRCNEDSVGAFKMHPVEINELLDVADAGLNMPPKSTWFEPKPRSGFVTRIFK